MTARRWKALWVVALLAAGCGSVGPTIPSSPEPTAPVGPQPAPSISPLVGQWAGSSIVESTSGLPACSAPFWRRDFTDGLSADIQLRTVGLDLQIHQRASEGCHLRIGSSGGAISAEPWPYDEFDCALVPSLCDLGCHFRLSAAEWNCATAPPEVWITGVTFAGTFTDVSQSRIQGTMEIRYDQRSGDSPRSTGYDSAFVIQRLDIMRISP